MPTGVRHRREAEPRTVRASFPQAGLPRLGADYDPHFGQPVEMLAHQLLLHVGLVGNVRLSLQIFRKALVPYRPFVDERLVRRPVKLYPADDQRRAVQNCHRGRHLLARRSRMLPVIDKTDLGHSRLVTGESQRRYLLRSFPGAGLDSREDLVATIIHGGDSLVLIVDINTKEVKFQADANMNFVGRAKSLSEVINVPLKNGNERIIIASDGLADVARMAKYPLEEMCLDSASRFPVNEVPEQLGRFFERQSRSIHRDRSHRS